jgi:hypothetical protein
MTRHEFAKRFQQTFKMPFRSEWSCALALQQGKFAFDPIAFDEFLHREFGEYEQHGKSMEDIVTEKYGKGAAELLESAF